MITASAPARIDLAGGTIDIWPVCHLLERPAVTVNLAIDRRAEAWVEPRDDGWVEIVSEDRRESVRLRADALRHDRLGLATRLLEWFGARSGVSIRMRSGVPPQSGLGGSSALAVALAGALADWHERRFERDRFREFVQTIETRLLGTPTGYQDYFPAIYGGLQVLTATPTGIERERIEAAEPFLARHLLLADTRLEHQSGLNNWSIVKRFLDGDAAVVRSLTGIAHCAARMAEALRATDLEATADALAEEWSLRRGLDPVVTNPEIERHLADAMDRGALAGKVCGAGGGGCLALLVPDATRFDLENPLPFTPTPHGLR